MEPTFSSTTFRSRSRSKVFQSQFRFSLETRNEPNETAAGASAARIAVQVASLPGSLPGNTIVPLDVLAGAYIRFTDSIWGAVRQLSESPALHSKVEGSNLHMRGSLRMPSLTPSFASHAWITALLSSMPLALETALAEFFKTGTDTLKSHVCKCV